MVFGHNLCYMAPFDFSRAGFCMVFRRASFVFSCPGADFGAQDQILDPQDQILDPRVTSLARGPFWPQKMVLKKNVVLWRNDFVVGFGGMHLAQMNSMAPRSHMGRLLCPKNPLKNQF